jgi:hypothetical protein
MNDEIIYSYYRAQRYTLYNASLSNFNSKAVDANDVNFSAAVLPPFENTGSTMVNNNLQNFSNYEQVLQDSLRTIPYKPKFKLDYLANSGVGVSTSRFGTGVQGGVVGMFSDILGRNQIIANVSINGEIQDFGGLAGYINQANRINWGFALSHIPYLTGFRDIAMEELPTNDPNTTVPAYNERTNIIRTFENQAQVFAAYPFSKVHRFEAGSAVSQYSYRVDRWSNYYQNIDGYVGGYLGSDRKKIPTEQASRELGITLRSFNIFQVNAGFVGDNSIMGLTAPLDGFRYRVSGEQYFGDYQFSAVNIDLRKYVRARPVTFAARAFSYMRLGEDGENLYPLYVGYPYLIRGYEANSFYNSNSAQVGTFDINQLSGSKMAVFNFEVRLPFTGPKQLAQIPSRFLISDLNLFFDAGLAWDEYSTVKFKGQPSGELLESGRPRERVPALSAGVSLRVNMFGYFVLEPYYAFPFQRKDVKAGVFGLTFAPGW